MTFLYHVLWNRINLTLNNKRMNNNNNNVLDTEVRDNVKGEKWEVYDNDNYLERLNEILSDYSLSK